MKSSLNKWLTVISILLLVANTVTLTLLWTNKDKLHSEPGIVIPPPPTGQAFEFITKELSLTQAQQDAYKILREEHQAVQRVLQDSIRMAKDAFFELLQSPAVNDSVLQKASNTSLAFQQQLELLTFKHFQKLRALCTREQQKRFDEIIKQVLLQMGGQRMRPQGPPFLPPGKDSGVPQPYPTKAEREDGPPPPGADMPPPPPRPGRREDGRPPKGNH